MPEIALAATITLQGDNNTREPERLVAGAGQLEADLAAALQRAIGDDWDVVAVEIGEEISYHRLAATLAVELDRHDGNADVDALARAALQAPLPPAARPFTSVEYRQLAACVAALVKQNTAWEEADLGAQTLEPETIAGLLDLQARLLRLG